MLQPRSSKGSDMSKLHPTIVRRCGAYIRINDHMFNWTSIASITKYPGVLRIETFSERTYDIVVDQGQDMQLTNIIFEYIHRVLGDSKFDNQSIGNQSVSNLSDDCRAIGDKQ